MLATFTNLEKKIVCNTEKLKQGNHLISILCASSHCRKAGSGTWETMNLV